MKNIKTNINLSKDSYLDQVKKLVLRKLFTAQKYTKN
jgi:hypothetical protein